MEKTSNGKNGNRKNVLFVKRPRYVGKTFPHLTTVFGKKTSSTRAKVS